MLIRSHGAADVVVDSSTGIEMALGGLLLLLLPAAILELVDVLGGVKAPADGVSRRRRAAVLVVALPKDTMVLKEEEK